MKKAKDFSVLGVIFFALIFLLSNMFLLQAVAGAADDEEMKVLRMYFTEDELVVSPTRSLKRLSQVPENMVIVTAEEIERMNAHSLPEVLERVTGMFVDFYGQDFGVDANIQIHGSSNKHVLLLLDGIPWNTLVEGNIIANTIPVRIINRIEIIKGPASSAWGSSLGGVINIVTKEAENGSLPGGMLSASLGERGTSDLSTEVSGDKGPVKYYLHAGKQESDGLRNDRWFDNETFYSKVNVALSSDTDFMFTAGYSEPHVSTGDLVTDDLSSVDAISEFFSTASIKTEIADNLTFDTSFYFFKQKFAQEIDELAILYAGIPGAIYKHTILNEKTSGVSGKFVLVEGRHTAVMGVDYSYGTVDQIVNTGVNHRAGLATTIVNSDSTKWDLFANDTISLGKLSVTPGIRYDYNNATGSFTSPSIGATYRLGHNTILRSSIAKGFNAPSLLATTAGGLFTDPNPYLVHEEIWSYQAGLESWAAGYMKVKFNMFHHDITNVLKKLPSVGSNSMYFNLEKSKRDGFEINLETAPFHDISVKTGYALIHKRTYYITDTSEDIYKCNLAVRYNDPGSFFAELAGNYTWWDGVDTMSKYDTSIWDLNLSKKISSVNKLENNLFVTVHNIFNGSYYITPDKKNPGRWMEVGLRSTF